MRDNNQFFIRVIGVFFGQVVAKRALKAGSEVTSAGVAPSQSHGSLVIAGAERRYPTTSV